MLKLILPIVLLLAASPALAAKVNLSGEVTYRERVALPETAVLNIELIDLAWPDRPRLSVSAPTGAGQVPLAFTLTFEDSLILPQHSYALNAQINAGDMQFRNVDPFPVSPLLQVEPVVIVTNLVAQGDEPSSEPVAEPEDLPLLGVTWQATAIQEVAVPAGIKVTLLVEDDMRAGGSGGCNSFFSESTVTADSFAIGKVAATARACPGGRMGIEQSYFAALKAAVTWTVDGDTLTLLDMGGKPVVTFER
jgi:putative lipoprotein